MIKVTYIYHDGFVVESPQATLVFDFWRDGAPVFADGNEERTHKSGDEPLPRFLSAIRRDVPLYVLVSHHHKDHFNRAIFRWKDAAGSVRFIISRDTEKSIRYMLRPDTTYAGVKPAPEQVTVLRPGEEYVDDAIHVRAFGSTDIGNSYMVDLAGRRMFHAGDLNAWIWKDESTRAEVAAALRDYNAILDTIAETCGTSVDLAMFPVDSRIGTDYWEGASVFVRRFDVGIFVPMHFGLGENEADACRKAADACRFEEYANPERGLYVALQYPYSALAMP